MEEYGLNKQDLEKFSVSGDPFMHFDEFVNLIKWHRNYHYAKSKIKGLFESLGKDYNIWTRKTISVYHRNLIFEEISGEVRLAFSIPHMQRFSTFPMSMTLYDENGVYFEHSQELAVERWVNDRFVLTAWKRVPEIKDFVESECENK